MIVRTYSGVWTVKARLMAIDDIRLPVSGGLAYQQIAVGTAAAALWWPLCAVTGLPGLTHNAGLSVVVWALLPVLAGWAADRPLAQERSLPEWVAAWVTFRFQPRQFTRLSPTPPTRARHVTATTWGRSRR